MILERHFYKQFLATGALVFFGLLGLIFFIWSTKYMGFFLLSRVPLGKTLTILGFLIFDFVLFAAPLGFLMATLWVAKGAVDHQEILALDVLGIGDRPLRNALCRLSALLGFLSFGVSLGVLPYVNRELARVEHNIFSIVSPRAALEGQGAFLTLGPLTFSGVKTHDGLKNVFVAHDFDDGALSVQAQKAQLTYAQNTVSGTLQNARLSLLGPTPFQIQASGATLTMQWPKVGMPIGLANAKRWPLRQLWTTHASLFHQRVILPLLLLSQTGWVFLALNGNRNRRKRSWLWGVALLAGFLQQTACLTLLNKEHHVVLAYAVALGSFGWRFFCFRF